MNSVEICSLCVRFGDHLVLDHLDLSVPPGQHVVLLGPSGCGKTTLLRAIAGLHRDITGEIRIDRQSVLGVPADQRGVSMVFQNSRLYPHMTVKRAIVFGAKGGSKATDPVSIDDAIELTGVGELLDRYPAQLSGGEMKRVALAKAIAGRSRLLLLDEPMSGLDAVAAREIESELMRIERHLGMTTLHVTHDGGEAMRVADKIAVMSRGKIAQFDNPATVYGRPVTIEVARRLSTEPINEFRGTVNLTTGAVQLRDARVSAIGDWKSVNLQTKQSSCVNVIMVIRPADAVAARLIDNSDAAAGAADQEVEPSVLIQPGACRVRSTPGTNQWCSNSEPLIRLDHHRGDAEMTDPRFVIPAANVLLFDAADGLNLMSCDGRSHT